MNKINSQSYFKIYKKSCSQIADHLKDQIMPIMVQKDFLDLSIQ